ncbi:MAG: hypothetical protein H0Z28_02635 [Archaeoglobus sp.]|nr:hypothetical protein [Archaeoglobus sp.]
MKFKGRLGKEIEVKNEIRVKEILSLIETSKVVENYNNELRKALIVE